MALTIKKNLVIGVLAIIIILLLILIGKRQQSETGFATYNLTISNSSFANVSQVVYQEIEKSLVKMGFFYPPENRYLYVGTGFIVDQRGYIITAKHNYEHYSSKASIDIGVFINQVGYVELQNDKGEIGNYKVDRIENKRLERKDTLLLKVIEQPNFKLYAVKIAPKEEIKLLSDVGFVGFTYIDENSPMQSFSHKGSISKLELNLSGYTEPVYAVQTYAGEGFSGAPVFLISNGKVFGLVKGGDINKGIMFVPPLHEIQDVIADS